MIFQWKFCLWLIDTLSMQSLTLREIQDKWQYATVNEEHTLLTARTFSRYYHKAELLMSVDIECDRRTNRYRLVCPDKFKDSSPKDWLLSAFRISNLTKRVEQRDKIMIEEAPPSADLLHIVMEAIDGKKALSFIYKSHYKSPQEVLLYPAFVRLFKQRWYVVGEVPRAKRTQVFSLERIKNIVIEEKVKVTFSKEFKPILTPKVYFKHCFGIIRQYEPIYIRFRAFWPQDSYLRDIPIHPSQRELNSTEDYTDFEIYVRPTYDLKQELLSHRDKLVVLSPKSFKEDMLSVLHSMSKGYETEQNYTIDE